MLTAAQKKLIRSLLTPKGRKESGRCLVEGEKVIETAGDAVELTFTRDELGEKAFAALVTTETPQNVAGVARIPVWTLGDIQKKKTIVVLDGVQDPGNVGTILRLCLGFDASLVLVESADTASPKVVRSSAGAFFLVPWVKVPRAKATELIQSLNRPVYRLEKTTDSQAIETIRMDEQVVLVAGSEGSGIRLESKGVSVAVTHGEALESLNVASALAIALFVRAKQTP